MLCINSDWPPKRSCEQDQASVNHVCIQACTHACIHVQVMSCKQELEGCRLEAVRHLKEAQRSSLGRHMHICIHARMHTCMYTCMHTCIHIQKCAYDIYVHR